jgi:putative membrane protein
MSSKPAPHASVPEEKRASEYLANERTFLAWIRTSIAIISVGFVITRVGPLTQHALTGEVRSAKSFGASFVMGIALMVLGAVLAVLAVSRYHVVNRAIDEGHVKADRGLVMLVTVLVVLFAIGMIVFMLATE